MPGRTTSRSFGARCGAVGLQLATSKLATQRLHQSNLLGNQSLLQPTSPPSGFMPWALEAPTFCCNPSLRPAASFTGPQTRSNFAHTHLATWRLRALDRWGAQWFCNPSRRPAASSTDPAGRPAFAPTHLAAQRPYSLGPRGSQFFCNPLHRPATAFSGPRGRPIYLRPVAPPSGFIHWTLEAPSFCSNPFRRPAAPLIGPFGRPAPNFFNPAHHSAASFLEPSGRPIFVSQMSPPGGFINRTLWANIFCCNQSRRPTASFTETLGRPMLFVINLAAWLLRSLSP